MSTTPEKMASIQRREQIISHSSEILADMPHTYGTQSFILSEQEANDIGEAIHTRNHRVIYDVIEPVLTSVIEDYEGTDASECIGIWNQTFSSLFGEGTTLNDLLTDDDTRELLNFALTNSFTTQLGLDSTEYLKLIESVAIATMPHQGYQNYAESRRSRTGGSRIALYNRCMTILNTYASLEPGMRTMREDVLNDNANALNKYLGSLVKAHSAQASLASIIDMTPYDVRRQKAQLERVFADQHDEHDLEIEDMLHVLEWKILTGDEDRETKHTRIKNIIAAQSQTEHQRRQLDYDWCPERLDFLIEIAETAKKENRHPSMYISNRFEEGAGVYVAVELDSPYNPEQKILFADNPIAGNALYIVDEVRLANENRPNQWQLVLGANRRIARERGAIRKYHTKNWQTILDKIMEMGELPMTPTTETSTTEHVPQRTEENDELQDSLIEQSRAARARLDAIIKATRSLIE